MQYITTIPSYILIPTVALLASSLNTATVAAEDFHSTSYGYHLDLPPDWIEIPQDVLQEFLSIVLKQNTSTSIIYDAGFQLGSPGNWFEYPYVLVQPMPYAASGLHRQIYEDEFSDYVEVITGLDVQKTLDETLSSESRQLVDNFDFGETQLDLARRRYLTHLDMDVQGVGPIRGLLVGYFGRESVVQIAFYSRHSDWDRFSDVRRAIVDSFRFAPDKAYDPDLAAANLLTSPIMQRVLVGAMLGAIGGALGGVVVFRMRKKSCLSQDTVDENPRT